MNRSYQLLILFGILSITSSLGGAVDNMPPQEEAVAALAKLEGIVERDKSKTGQPIIGITFEGFRDREYVPDPAPKASEFDFLKSLTSLQRFELHDTCLGDVEPILERLAGLKGLRSLKLHFCEVTDHKLRHLRSLTALEELELSYNKDVSDKGIAILEFLPHLRRLDLASTGVGDASAGIIGRLGHLEELSLENASGIASLTDRGIKDLRGLSHLKRLDLTFTHVTDDGLRYLEGMRELKYLSVQGTKITDGGLDHITKLRQLEELVLSRTLVTDKGIKKLSALANLKMLALGQLKITGEGLGDLQSLGDLERLSLYETKVGDVGLKHVAGIPTLRYLDLRVTEITDTGMLHLGKLKKLQSLTISSKTVTGKGLAGLEGLSSLESLCLYDLRLGITGLSLMPKLPAVKSLRLHNTKLGDDDLKCVRNLPSLESVNLVNTSVTDTGLAELKAASKLKHIYISAFDKAPLVTAEGIRDLQKSLPEVIVH